MAAITECEAAAAQTTRHIAVMDRFYGLRGRIGGPPPTYPASRP